MFFFFLMIRLPPRSTLFPFPTFFRSRLGIAAGVGTLAAACGWDGGRLLRPVLLDIGRVNDWVGEKILFSPTRLARTYSTAERSAMLPSYFISTMTPMLDDPAACRLRVDARIAQPLHR